MLVNLRRGMLALGALCLGLGVVACSPQVPAASPACDEAFTVASAAMNEHYATDPFFGPEYDALYEDGTISDEEQVTLDEMMANEAAAFAALIDPVLDACDGWQDLYAGGYSHRNDADWGLIDNEYVSREEARNLFVVGMCVDHTDRPACADFDVADW